MDIVFKFWGMLAIAYAIHSGLHAISGAIQNRVVDVKFSAPIEITHRSDNGPSS